MSAGISRKSLFSIVSANACSESSNVKTFGIGQDWKTALGNGVRVVFPKGCKRQRIFISYAREDAAIAEEIAQGMRNRGDTVFFDKDSLLPGEDFNIRIERTIETCDKFVFLATRSSLEGGGYALTELSTAKAKWPSPVGRVLTVLADSTISPADLDAYLRSVQVLSPGGNLVAETVRAVDRNRPIGLFCRLVALLLFLATLVGGTVLAWSIYSGFSGRRASMEQTGPVHVAQWTGAPFIGSRLRFTNPLGRDQVITFDQVRLEGPDGQRIAIGAYSILITGMRQPPQGVIFLESGQALAFDYEFNAPLGAALATHQEMGRLLSMQPAQQMVPSPGVELVPPHLVTEFQAAARKDNVWRPGEWSMVIDYTAGDSPGVGETHTLRWSFELAQANIDAMMLVLDDYATGAGVFPNWLSMDRYGNSTYQTVSVQGRPELQP